MIAIVDYGMGNIASVINMFKRIGNRDVVYTRDINVIKQADKILLPGVGAFDNGMDQLISSGVIDVLNERVLVDKVPTLGICLGMQLMTRGSEEGTKAGLGWIAADCKKFQFQATANLKIPHMGWNYIHVNHQSPLADTGKRHKFYFVHSYYVVCDRSEDITATCNYGFDFTCMIQHGNIYGAQFHPEKSHKFGMELLEKFSKL